MLPSQINNKQKDNNKSTSFLQPSHDKSFEYLDHTQKAERKKRISKPKPEKSKKSNFTQSNSKKSNLLAQQSPTVSQQFPPQPQISSQQQQQFLCPFSMNICQGYSQQQLFEMQSEDSLQEILPQKKQCKEIYNLEEKLILDIKLLQKHFQFNKNQDQTIPIMVTVKTQEQTHNMEFDSNTLEDRPNIDLICVIDNSGSMSGCSKIQNVQNTILQLIEILNENDRLSLITFNSRAFQHCALRKVNKKNKELLQTITKLIKADGGTNITSGLQSAFETLQNRKQKNQVSSIFLLSDGQDDNSDIKIRNLLQTTNQQLQEENFTIHSFGFGNDHDGPLMQKIAQIKDGSFYYIENSDQVDEFFINALGGLFSVVAKDLTIKIEINRQNELFHKFFQNSYVSKIYGHMWNIVKQDQEFIIKINQIFSGVSKDFIFEMTVPKSEIKVLQDFERNIDTIKVQLTASPLESEQTKILKENNLVLTLFTENEQIAQDLEMNSNVEFNYIRVKAAQAIENAMKYADRNQYKEGQMILSDMLKNIEKSHPNNKSKLQVLKEDLIQCQQNVQPQVYQFHGRHQAQQQSHSHYQQQSQAIRKNDMYQQSLQRQMVQKQKQMKQQQQQIQQLPQYITQQIIQQPQQFQQQEQQHCQQQQQQWQYQQQQQQQQQYECYFDNNFKAQ